MLTLGALRGLVVIDEIQRMPELFELLRVLADRPDAPARFLVLGSASPRLIQGASESLAGRVAFVDLSGFDLSEIGADSVRRLWLRGRFPRSYLAADDDVSFRWRRDFLRTFLELDLASFGSRTPPETLRRFWTMVAHCHGQVLNLSELARSLGAAQGTAGRYLDLLSGAYVVRLLQPWHANLKKRQVKAPKVYVRDSGLLHALLSLATEPQLQSHPKLGASWEGFVVEEILTAAGDQDAYFWATHAGAELDLLLMRRGSALGFEVKYTDAPRTTRSMRVALQDLDLEHLYVVYPGARTFPLDERITALAVGDLWGVVG